jgi:branched-chain amino acid transport system substrate-binding protein
MGISRRFLIAAGVAAPMAGRAASKHAPSPPSLVGVLLPQTGPGALVGNECFRGIQMAAADVNAAGGIAGRALTLIAQDAPGEGQAQGAAKALIGAHAGVLLGSGSSAIAYPASAAAELAQEPYVELTAMADGVTGRGFKFLLRSCETTSMIAGVATAAIAKTNSSKKIALLFNTGATSGAIAAAAVSTFKTMNISPSLVVGYPEAVADLHEPVGRLRRAGTEILLHAGSSDDVLLLFQAMENLRWRPAQIYGCGDGYGTRETAYALGSNFDGVFSIGAPFYPPRADYLFDAYQARFGMAPRSADSLTAYVGAKLVFDILSQQNGNVATLLDALRRADIPPGTLANGFGVAFDKTGQNARSFAILQQWRSQVLAAVES